jgi:hypothetical protein
MGCGSSSEAEDPPPDHVVTPTVVVSETSRIGGVPTEGPQPTSPSEVSISSVSLHQRSLSTTQQQHVSTTIQNFRADVGKELGSVKQEVSLLKQDLRDEVQELKHELREMKATVEIFVHQSQISAN